MIPCLISYARGTLLGAAFLGLIPHALEHTDPSAILAAVLAGLVLFFALVKLLLWRHCHQEQCEIHGATGPLILIGDAFHTVVRPAASSAPNGRWCVWPSRRVVAQASPPGER